MREAISGGSKTSFDAEQVSKLIDEALCALGGKDRTALTLRYLQNKSQREVAEAMGVSENAAAKRLSRALRRVRNWISGHGGPMLAPVMLGDTMLHHFCCEAPELPPHLAQSLADTAFRLPAMTSASSVAMRIAADALLAMHRRSIGIAAAIVAAVLVLAGAGAIAMQANSQNAGAMRHTSKPVRVGVYISAETALPMPPERDAWFQQFRIVDELRDGQLELIPVIEPGHDQQPQQKRLLRYYFGDKRSVYVTDTPALSRLDVLVASSAHYAPTEALASIESAVERGTGLFIRGCLGGCKPGFTNASVRKLFAASHTVTAESPGPIECVVVTDHPILGSLSTKSAQSMSLYPGCVYGELPDDNEVPLLRLKPADALSSRVKQPPLDRNGPRGDVLYVHDLGQGRVVNFNCGTVTPDPLQQATKNRFVARTVLWLAHRPPE